MSLSAPVLEADALAVQVAGRRLCSPFDFRLEAGQCLALIGANGAGKTTLLHTLAGLRAPAAGRVLFDGRAVNTWAATDAARFRGLLAQQQPDHFAATVLETVLIGRHPHIGRWAWESEEDRRLARQALHAAVLTLPHPTTRAAVRFEAPLAPDLADFVAGRPDATAR